MPLGRGRVELARQILEDQGDLVAVVDELDQLFHVSALAQAHQPFRSQRSRKRGTRVGAAVLLLLRSGSA